MSKKNSAIELAKKRNLFFLLIATILFFALILGCASLNTGDTYNSSISGFSATYVKPKDTVSENLLAVIRFPAFFSDEAFEKFSAHYALYPLNLSGKKPTVPSRNSHTSLYANEAINKTAYFAIEFYHILTRKLPSQSVILQPLEVFLDDYGRLVTRPVNMYPPSVLIIDFFIYRTPEKDITKEVPLTFGDLVSPLISIQTSPEASPSTFGAISYVDPLVPFVHNLDSTRGGAKDNGHAFIKYLSNPDSTKSLGVPTTSKQPRGKNQILNFPLLNLKMKHAAIEAQAQSMSINSEKSPFFTAISAHINATIDALNTIDHSLATRIGNKHFIELYDPALSNKLSSSNLGQDDYFKLQLIHKFKSLERKFLAKQCQDYYNRLFLGDYGKSIRKLMISEMKYIAKVRDNTSEASESKFWKNTAFVMNLAANFLAGFSGQPIDNSYNTKTQTLMTSYDAKITSYEKENRELTEAFQNSFFTTYIKQTQYRSVVLEGERTIHAKNLSELREKLLIYYNQTTASLGASAN